MVLLLLNGSCLEQLVVVCFKLSPTRDDISEQISTAARSTSTPHYLKVKTLPFHHHNTRITTQLNSSKHHIFAKIMSEPLNQHHPLDLSNQQGGELATTAFGLEIHAHTLPLAENLFPPGTDLDAYNWEEIFRDIGAPDIQGYTLPALNSTTQQLGFTSPIPETHSVPQDELLLPLGAGPQNITSAPINASQDIVGLQRNAPLASDTLEHSIDTGTSIFDASGDLEQQGSALGAFLGAKFTMDQEPEVGDSEDEVCVGTIRTRPKLSKEELAKKKVTMLVNRERRLAADADAAEMKGKWDEEIAIFNEKHGYSPSYTHPLLGLSQILKTVRGPSAGNALNSKAAAYFNAGEYFSMSILNLILTSGAYRSSPGQKAQDA